MMGRYKIFKKWHQDDENEELTSFGEVEDEIGFYVEQASVIFRFSKSNIGTTVDEVKNYFSENNTKVIGVLESKYDVDISSELTSQMDELVEYMSQLDLLNIDYKLIANNTIIKENIGYVEKILYQMSLKWELYMSQVNIVFTITNFINV